VGVQSPRAAQSSAVNSTLPACDVVRRTSPRAAGVAWAGEQGNRAIAVPRRALQSRSRPCRFGKGPSYLGRPRRFALFWPVAGSMLRRPVELTVINCRAISQKARLPYPTKLPRRPFVVEAVMGRYCCKSRKLQGDEFFAKLRNGKQSPIRIASLTLAKSPVSLT
jgi:hypothetical protein